MNLDKRLTDIEKKAARFRRYSIVERAQDERRGRTHGLAGFPVSDGDDHPYENRLRQEVKQPFARIAHEIQTLLNELSAEKRRLEDEREQAHANTRRNLLQARDDDLERLQTKHGPRSVPYEKAQAYRDEAAMTERRIADELNRACWAKLPLWAYLAVLAAIALGELPVNQVAFSQIVPGSNMGPALVALLLGVVTALAAHLIGDQLRQSRRRPGWRRNASRYLSSLLMATALMVVFWFVAHLRQAVLSLQQAAEATISEASQQALTNLATIELDMTGWAMFGVNMVIFGAGIITSWLAHDPEPSYLRAIRQRKRWERRLQRLQQRYERRRNHIEETYDPQLRELDNRLVSIDRDIEESNRNHEQVFQHAKGLADAAAHYLAARLTTYEAANRAARTDYAPRSFGTFDPETFAQELLVNVYQNVHGDRSDNADNNSGVRLNRNSEHHQQLLQTGGHDSAASGRSHDAIHAARQEASPERR